MKKKGLIIALAVVVVLAVAVALILWKRKKGQPADPEPGTGIQSKSKTADTVAPSVQATSSAPAKEEKVDTSAKYQEAKTLGSVSYNSNERSITVDGQKYVIPSRDKVKEVQRNLIEGLEYAAKNNSAVVGSVYKYYADAMKKSTKDGTGIDGIIGKATANAFAITVKLMPSAVKVYKV